MSSAIPTVVTIAPRGKVFAVVSTCHTVAGRMLPLVLHSGWLTRSGAEAARDRCDPSLKPQVTLIDALRAEEVKP